MDYQYLCEKITITTGCITRFYHDGVIIAQHSLRPLIIDPIAPHFSKINYLDKPIGIISTPLFQNIGYVAVDNSTVFVIGPTMPIIEDALIIEQDILTLNLPKSQHADYKEFLLTLPRPTISELANKLAFFYHLISGKKVSIEYILGEHSSLGMDTLLQNDSASQANNYLNIDPTSIIKKSYDFEIELMSAIRLGQLDKLNKILRQSTTITTGELSKDSLRQHKNLFICTTTLATRTAIDGGLDCILALQASDAFIQRAEALVSELAINYLLTEMLIFFTEKVNQLNLGASLYSPLIKRVISYIAKNLSQPLKVADIAAELHVNRSYLSKNFIKYCNISISEYIIKQKIQESKRLLIDTDIAISEISYLLYFSSQSHYQNVFKKLEGLTPRKFRQKYKMNN